jgi:hypothetical protein
METTKVLPFFANYSYEVDLWRGPRVLVPRVEVKVDQLYTLYTTLKKDLEFIRNRIKQYYDKYRLEGPCLERGDKVYLIVRNL